MTSAGDQIWKDASDFRPTVKKIAIESNRKRHEMAG